MTLAPDPREPQNPALDTGHARQALDLAVEDGYQRARDRLDSLGLRLEALHQEGLRLDGLAKETVRALTREGAIATLTARAQLNRSQRLTPENVIRLVEDLTASPWEDGPIRQRVYTELDTHLRATTGTRNPTREALTRARTSPASDTIADVDLAAEHVRARADEQRLTDLTTAPPPRRSPP